MVPAGRPVQRIELGFGRIVVVHHYRGHPGGAPVFQICVAEPVPLWQGGRLRRRAPSLLLNILWLVLSGLPLAISHAVWGCVLCLTIVGIPFGLQFFKIARLALFPFGSRVLDAC